MSVPTPADTADHLRTRFALGDDTSPRLALVLGSGLGGLADRLDAARRAPYGEIPGWPASTVEGHAGELLCGELAGTPVLAMAGRVHLYEGGDPARVAFPIRVLAEIGIESLVLSNAAGGVREDLAPGTLMLLTDHLNLTGRNPLVGPVVGDEDRFPDMTDAYDPQLRQIVRDVAADQDVALEEGVYAAMLGPSYETPAEVRSVATLGADAVGMSTVPEVIVARARGIRCVAVSCITNRAAGVGEGALDHEEVLETTERVASAFQDLIAESVRRISATDPGG